MGRRSILGGVAPAGPHDPVGKLDGRGRRYEPLLQKFTYDWSAGGWAYDPDTRTVRVTDGGEISARFVSPKPLGTPPLPREQWTPPDVLARWAGWRRDLTTRAGRAVIGPASRGGV